MNILRRFLGVLVMIAGILGLLLSVTGLVAVWMVKPDVYTSVSTTVTRLDTSIETSRNAMEIAGKTLSAAVSSVDALSEMLANTAVTVEDTQPVMTKLNTVIGKTLPSTLEAASESLVTAQQAAAVLDDAIRSLETFRMILSATPLLGSFIQPSETYNPEVPLAESLGQLATELDNLPATFTSMSGDIDKADDNLATIQENLTTMSASVAEISVNLADYESMLSESQASMTALQDMLGSLQRDLGRILNWTAGILTLFLLWLLAAQIVILSQGWELYHGTADRMDNGSVIHTQSVTVVERDTPEPPEKTL
ncbi:MAG: hypothetical protein AAGU05_00385 [Anaerolineaceae bacterium]